MATRTASPLAPGNIIRAQLRRNSQRRLYRVISATRSGAVELAMVWEDDSHSAPDFVQGNTESFSRSDILSPELVHAAS